MPSIPPRAGNQQLPSRRLSPPDASSSHVQRVAEIVDTAARLPRDEREAFIDAACAGDVELRATLDRLLDASERPSSSAPSETQEEDHVPDPRKSKFASGALSILSRALAGKYTIEHELGRGGMATVYLAQDERHPRKVAIKLVGADYISAIGLERFLRELTIASALRHVHIVPVYDSGDVDGLLYYVMPYIEGMSLRARIDAERQLATDEVLVIARDIGEALDYAHASGVVHRDIKPENILLENGHALVADFGVARPMHPSAEQRLTGTGIGVGTPSYMSPEQAVGDSQIDGRSDVYSLGCVVYEMLCGEAPFTAASAGAVLAKHMHETVPSIRVLRPALSSEAQRVIEKALAKVPADRFRTAGEFVRALGDALASAPGVPSRRWPLVAAVLLSAIAAATLYAVTLGRSVPSGRSEVSTATEPRIAVLYFDDLTPDSSLSQVADGLTEELIHELSGVNAFRVVSRNGVKTYRGRRVTLDSIVAALRVNTVIEGSVQKIANQLRVSVALIDARTNTYADQVTVERPLADFGGLESSVAQEVAAALRRTMGREVRLRGALAGTTVDPAKILVLKARRARDDAELLAEHPHPADRNSALDDLSRADSLLSLAQRADAAWSRPLLDRGWTAYQKSRLMVGRDRMRALEVGLGFANEAIRRDSNEAEALDLRGTLTWAAITETEIQAAPTDTARMTRAEADLRAAVDRDFTLAGAYAALSDLLAVKGSFAEAELAAERALREDSYLTEARGIYSRLFFGALMLGDFARAREWCRRGRESAPNDWRFMECELTLLRHDIDAPPNPARAWALVAELERVDRPNEAKAAGREYHTIYRRVVAATISARSGHPELARAELARAIQATKGDTSLRLDLAYDEAYLRLVLGERDRARLLLQSLIKARPILRGQLARDPLFRGLRVSE
jgi:serine/threonine protein kinase/tetratricopeptide (TPR) repeat protein